MKIKRQIKICRKCPNFREIVVYRDKPAFLKCSINMKIAPQGHDESERLMTVAKYGETEIPFDCQFYKEHLEKNISRKHHEN